MQTRTFEITVPISLPPTVSPHDLIENATSQIERELHDALGGEVHVAAALDLAASGSPLTGKLVLLGLGAAEKEASVADGDFEAFVIIIVRRALRLVFRSLEIHAEPNVRIAAVATNTADKPVRFWNRMELTPISSWIVPAFLGALGGILLLAVVITASWYSLSSAKHHPSTGLLASKTDPQFAAQKTTIDLEQAYREAIAKAAVRAPLKVRLATIDRNQPHVSVVHLSRYYPFERGKLLKDAGELPKDGRLAGDTWVALELELAALCRGKSDALLALNQILGLRHKESERDGLLVMHLKVAPADMFRPCVGASVIDRLCRLELSKTARDDFVLQQAWNTHRVGFEEDGYPFTGMGWSYNWAPDSPNHIGVTEFVVQKDAPANIIRTETPEEFCNLSGEAVGISGDKQSKPE